ncbi:MAG: hypothetical protein KDK08_23105 [Rhizobiaceae bacterium]|nr:hypothetical protein [Rhizobiaceae bacterium]
MNFDDDERQRSTLRRLAHEAQDFDDLQNEIAGREVGRAGRFLPDAVKNGVGSAKEAEKRADALTRLQLALQSNPAYAALNNETGEALGHAQRRLDEIMERTRRAIETAEAALEEKRSHAARLEDGTLVYRKRNGHVSAEDGSPMQGNLFAAFVWRGYEHTYAKVQKDRERLLTRSRLPMTQPVCMIFRPGTSMETTSAGYDTKSRHMQS